MNVLHKIGLVTLAGLAVLLSGCADGPAAYVRMDLPGTNGGYDTLIVHKQPPALVSRISGMKLDGIVSGNVTKLQREFLANATKACRSASAIATPDLLATLSIDVLGLGSATAGGTAVGSRAFLGTNASQYGWYGFGIGGFAGLYNGLITHAATGRYNLNACGQAVSNKHPSYGVTIMQ